MTDIWRKDIIFTYQNIAIVTWQTKPFMRIYGDDMIYLQTGALTSIEIGQNREYKIGCGPAFFIVIGGWGTVINGLMG